MMQQLRCVTKMDIEKTIMKVMPKKTFTYEQIQKRTGIPHNQLKPAFDILLARGQILKHIDLSKTDFKKCSVKFEGDNQ